MFDFLKKIFGVQLPPILSENEISDLEKIVRWTDNEIQFFYEFNDTFENVYFHWLIDTQI